MDSTGRVPLPLERSLTMDSTGRGVQHRLHWRFSPDVWTVPLARRFTMASSARRPVPLERSLTMNGVQRVGQYRLHW